MQRYYNQIEDQQLTHANQLTVHDWNRIINILKAQANNNTANIEYIFNWLGFKDVDNIAEYLNNLHNEIYAEIESTAGALTTYINSEVNLLNARITKEIEDINTSLSAHDTRITTAQNAANNAQNTADLAKHIAEGKAQSYVFDNLSQMQYELSHADNTKYRVADNLYIKSTGVPDYWVSGILETPTEPYGYYTVSILETQKVVLDIYQTINEDTLNTNAKTIPGAINEVLERTDDERIKQIANEGVDLTELENKILNLETHKVIANPVLEGNEDALTSIGISGKSFKVIGSGGGSVDTLYASKVIFDDGETLAEKYANGDLGIGGGGVDDDVILTAITDSNITVASGDEYNIIYMFERLNNKTRTGAEEVYVDNSLYSTRTIEQGEVNCPLSLPVGEHNVIIKVSSSGITQQLKFTVNAVELRFDPYFTADTVFDKEVTYRFIAYGRVEKTMHFLVGDKEYTKIVENTGVDEFFTMSDIPHGAHTLTVYMTATINEKTVYSNTETYDIAVDQGLNAPIISCTLDNNTVVQGDVILFNCLVYTPGSLTSELTLVVNDETIGTRTMDRTRQPWAVREYPIGDVDFIFKCGTTTRIFTVSVTENTNTSTAVTAGLELYLSSKGRSNQDTDSIKYNWSYDIYSAEFNNFNWVTNGWVLDDEYESVMRVNGGATITIPIKIFNTNLIATGKTIELEFATHDIRNYDSVLINCMSGGRGFSVTSNIVTLTSSSVSTQSKFKEDEKIRVSFVVEPVGLNRIIYTYINGVQSGIVQYSEGDNFTQIPPVDITIGSPEATIDLYNIRVYKTNLNKAQIVNNFIADTVSNTTKAELVTSNNILDDYGGVVYNKVVNLIPCLTIIGPLPGPDAKVPVYIKYEDRSNIINNIDNKYAEIEIQGTSSKDYPRKNYKFTFKDFTYKLTTNSIPENLFCIKADYMESSHSHNTGIAKIVNKLYPMTPPKELNANVQSAITGFPIVVWNKPTENSTELNCLGIYNFNNDKGNAKTYGYTTDFPQCESWEFRDNDLPLCLFDSDDFTNLEEVATSFASRYPKKYTNYNALKRVISWVYSTKNDLTKFKNEFTTYFNLEATLLYYCLTDVFAMVDSRAKNLFLTTWDGQIWYPTFYDLDTAFGLNNVGENRFEYSVEYHDKAGSGNVYNAESSVLWNNFEQAYETEIIDFYVNLRNSGILTYDTILEVLKGEQIDKLSESLYNYDAIEKYNNPLIYENIKTYAYASQGTRLDHLKRWVYNRLRFTDSKNMYSTGIDNVAVSTFKEDVMSLRIYIDEDADYGVSPNPDVTVTPYTDQYIVVEYDTIQLKERGWHNQAKTIKSPIAYPNDKPLRIFGASSISDIGDLSPMYCTNVEVSKAVRLKKLIVGNPNENYENKNLKSVTVGNNTLLTEIDIRNCPNLTAPLDVSGCTNIEKVYATGTSITEVNLPNGGNLHTLHIPATVTNLTICNQPYITDFQCAGYNALNTIRIENASINTLDIVKASINTLQRVRLLNIDWQVSDLSILRKLLECTGLDEYNKDVAVAVVTGKIHVRIPIGSHLYNNLKNTFPNLTITYTELLNSYKCTFVDWDNSILYETYVDQGAYATYGGSTPHRESTEDITYEFIGWYPELSGKQIISDTTFSAVYSESQYATIKWVNYNGAVLKDDDKVTPGTYITYTGDIPVRNSDNIWKDYVHVGWLDTYGNTYPAYEPIRVTYSTTMTAVFEGSPQEYTVMFYSENKPYSQPISVKYGNHATAPAVPPIKLTDNEYSYTFSHWVPDIKTTIITQDTRFDAVFTPTPLLVINWKNWDGSTLYTSRAQAGSSVSYIWSNPTRPDDSQYKDYVFMGWLDDDTYTFHEPGASIVVNKNTNITAQYSGTIQTYIVNWYNGNELLGTSDLEYGILPEYLGDTPTKENNYVTQERYEFRGWEPSPIPIESNVDFHAQYHTIKYYEVIFKNWDGTILQTVNVDSGGTAIYTGPTPTRPDEDGYMYIFNGWDKELTNVTSNLIVTTIFISNKPTIFVANITENTTPQIRFSESTRETIYNYTVDWGDGEISTGTTNYTGSVYYMHKQNPYNTTDTYTIKINLNPVTKPSVLFNTVSLEGNGLSIISIDLQEGIFRNAPYLTSNKTIQSVYIPEGVTNMPDRAFYRCESLKTVVVPTTITALQQDCFKLRTGSSGTPTLTLIMKGTTPPACTSGCLGDTSYRGIKEIRVPMESVEAYKSAPIWSDFANYIVGYEVKDYYTVTFKDYDDTILQEKRVPIGRDAVYSGPELVGPDTEDEYPLVFAAWDSNLNCVVQDIVCKALYRSPKPTTFTLNLTDSKYLTPTVYITGIKGTGTIDWGDGTYVNVTPSGAAYSYTKNTYYPSTGVYTITVDVQWTELKEVTEIELTSNYSPFVTAFELNPCINMFGMICMYNTNLTSIEIPNSITSIYSYAFSGCSNLESVYYNGTIEDWCKISLNDYDATPMRYAKHLYMLNENNEYYEVTEIEIPDTTTKIGDYQFYGFNITKVIIPNSVTSIGTDAFGGIPNLEYNIKDNIKYLGNTTNLYVYLAGSIDTTINAVSISENTKIIMSKAFNGCSNLTSVTIPNSVTSIGAYAFNRCTNLANVVIGNNVTSIGQRAFYECKSLTSITIPDSVTSVEDEAFYYCTNLTSVVIGNSVTSIGTAAFRNCTSLTSVIMGNNVTRLYQNVFYECKSLTNLTIPSSVNTIDSQALYIGSAENKATVTFKSTVPCTINYNSLNKNYLQEIRVPMESVDAYKSATYWSNFADYIVGYTE